MAFMRQMDKDRNGRLSAKEIMTGFDSLKLGLTQIQVAELVNRMDVDGDGEYVVHCNTVPSVYHI